MHYPGANFMGPGTHVIQRINDGLIPTSREDAIALIHDLEYLRAAGDPWLLDLADQNAIHRLGNTAVFVSSIFPELFTRAWAMNVGLKSRRALQLKPNFGDNSVQSMRNAADAYLDYIHTEPKFLTSLQKYGLA